MRKRIRRTGFSLIAICILLTLFIGSFLFRYLNIHNDPAKIDHNAKVLNKAKEMLLYYAIKNLNSGSDRIPGFLPCPDLDAESADEEGSGPANCGKKNVSVLGRFPWRTLGIEPLYDKSGECLWYAVSGTHISSPETEMLNWDTEPLLQVYSREHAASAIPDLHAGEAPSTGQLRASRAVAVLIAPGTPLPGQKRESMGDRYYCPGNYDSSNYLDQAHEIDNAQLSTASRADSRLIADLPRHSFNDQLLLITRADLFDYIERHRLFQERIDELVRESAQCLLDFSLSDVVESPGDRRLPWAAPLQISNFLDNAAYGDQENLIAGRLPFDISHSLRALAPARRNSQKYLLQASGHISSGCNFSSVSRFDHWYKHWKDQLFYVVDRGFSPNAAIPSHCDPCLSVGDQKNQYAAIVFFAGRPLTGQHRTESHTITDYLESGSVLFTDPGASVSSDKLAMENDIRWCIRADMEGIERC